MASSSGDSLSPPRPLDVLYAAPRVNSDSWAFSAKLVRNFEITGNFCRCKIFFKNFENFCQPDRYGGNGGSGSESRPRVRPVYGAGKPGSGRGGCRASGDRAFRLAQVWQRAARGRSQLFRFQLRRLLRLRLGQVLRAETPGQRRGFSVYPAWNWLLEPKITGNKDSAFYSTKCLRNSTAR